MAHLSLINLRCLKLARSNSVLDKSFCSEAMEATYTEAKRLRGRPYIT